MVDEKKDVIKHSAAVHIQNNITLLQRRAWNVLLANAYDELLDEEEHSIRTKELMRVLEFDSKNEEYLRESLEAIVSCKVKWNVLDKDDHWEWGVTTLLAHATIKSGNCIYSYSPPLRRRLYNPNLYARISLSLQNKFDSKHSLALWELCVDYLDDSKKYGATPFMPIDTFRELMGLKESVYVEQFKILNRDVIKPSVKEINEETDFQVTVEFKRKGRKIVALQFRIRRVLQIPAVSNRQETLFPELEDIPALVIELQTAGLAKQEAWVVWQQGFEIVDSDKRPEDVKDGEFERYVREKIHLLKRQEPHKIRNKAGFLLSAIKRDFVNPYFCEEKREVWGKQITHNGKTANLEQDRARQKQDELERKQQEQIKEISIQILNEIPGLIDQVIDQILSAEPSYRHFYENQKTPIQNYHEHVFLAAAVESQLIDLYPNRFKGILIIDDKTQNSVDV